MPSDEEKKNKERSIEELQQDISTLLKNLREKLNSAAISSEVRDDFLKNKIEVFEAEFLLNQRVKTGLNPIKSKLDCVVQYFDLILFFKKKMAGTSELIKSLENLLVRIRGTDKSKIDERLQTAKETFNRWEQDIFDPTKLEHKTEQEIIDDEKTMSNTLFGINQEIETTRSTIDIFVGFILDYYEQYYDKENILFRNPNSDVKQRLEENLKDKPDKEKTSLRNSNRKNKPDEDLRIKTIANFMKYAHSYKSKRTAKILLDPKYKNVNGSELKEMFHLEIDPAFIKCVVAYAKEFYGRPASFFFCSTRNPNSTMLQELRAGNITSVEQFKQYATNPQNANTRSAKVWENLKLKLN